MAAQNGFLDVYVNATVHTLDLEDYLDSTTVGVIATSDFLYVGYRKPINAFYIDFTSANTNSSVLTLEYYSNSGFVSVNGLVDRTRGFSRSELVKWDRNQTNEAKTTINSIEQFWYRISVSADTTSLVCTGLNLLFSDDAMIKEEAPHVLSSDYYPAGEDSWIGCHQAARNEIIQRLRTEGYSTKTANTFNDVTIFDLLDHTQLSVASKYLVLSKIFFFLSDSPDDKYYQKYEDYKRLYNDAFKTFFLAIDYDDDGVLDTEEKGSFKSGIIIRV